MATRIITTRHADISNWDSLGKVHPRVAAGSNSRGLIAAEKTRKFLMDEPIDLVFCSPVMSAIDTARIISRGRGIDPEIADFLNARGLGAHEAEEFHEMEKRVISGLQEIFESNAGKTILIVTHDEPIASILGWIRNMSHEEKMAIEVPETAITDFELENFERDDVKINLFNSIEHLN